MQQPAPQQQQPYGYSQEGMTTVAVAPLYYSTPSQPAVAQQPALYGHPQGVLYGEAPPQQPPVMMYGASGVTPVAQQPALYAQQPPVSGAVVMPPVEDGNTQQQQQPAAEPQCPDGVRDTETVVVDTVLRNRVLCTIAYVITGIIFFAGVAVVVTNPPAGGAIMAMGVVFTFLSNAFLIEFFLVLHKDKQTLNKTYKLETNKNQDLKTSDIAGLCFQENYEGGQHVSNTLIARANFGLDNIEMRTFPRAVIAPDSQAMLYKKFWLLKINQHGGNAQDLPTIVQNA